jgi:acyl transferase domain-containing protein
MLFPPRGPSPAFAPDDAHDPDDEDALFVQELELARMWRAFGVTPSAMCGLGVGERVAAHLAGVIGADGQLGPPRIPFVTGSTGTWITDGEAADPSYWARQRAQRVHFFDAVFTLLLAGDHVLLEAGPAQTLALLARKHPRASGRTILASLGPRPNIALLEALAGLVLAGVDLDAVALRAGTPRWPVGA